MTRPIGIFDSGVGGLSVLREVRRLLPAEPLLYLADQANAPYGGRSLAEVRGFAERITRFLLAREAKVIVVACNTASAAALHWLRRQFPEGLFVGMEPAVKPAAELSGRRTVGVLATGATFQGELFASVVDRFANGVRVIPQACPGLADLVEQGRWEPSHAESLLRRYLDPLLAEGIDTLVLACTHYTFLAPAILRLVGEDVTIVDPAPAVAHQVGQVLERARLAAPLGGGPVTYLTTGDPATLRRQVAELLGDDVTVERAEP